MAVAAALWATLALWTEASRTLASRNGCGGDACERLGSLRCQPCCGGGVVRKAWKLILCAILASCAACCLWRCRAVRRGGCVCRSAAGSRLRWRPTDGEGCWWKWEFHTSRRVHSHLQAVWMGFRVYPSTGSVNSHFRKCEFTLQDFRKCEFHTSDGVQGLPFQDTMP